MSWKVAKLVLESDLSPELKPLASTLAGFGNDQGEQIFPSVDRLAWLLGLHRRSIQRHLVALKRLGVLVPRSNSRGGRTSGGRGRPVIYRLDVTRLPPRGPYRGPFAENPDTSAGVPGLEYRGTSATLLAMVKGGAGVVKGGAGVAKGGAGVASRVALVPPEYLSEALEEREEEGEVRVTPAPPLRNWWDECFAVHGKLCNGSAAHDELKRREEKAG